MPSSHLILCRPLLLLPPIPSSIRVFSNESALRMRWPKYWSFSFSISPSNEHPGLISYSSVYMSVPISQYIPFSPLFPSGNHRFVWSFCMVIFFRRIGLGIHFFYDLTPASSCGLVHVLEGLVHRISEDLSSLAHGILLCMLRDFSVLALLLKIRVVLMFSMSLHMSCIQTTRTSLHFLHLIVL